MYAALDVELLVDLREALGKLLDDDGKGEIAREEFEATLARDFRVVREQPWRRLSGLHSVRGVRGLAVARELWQARDEYARETETAPGRLVPDAALVAAARVLPTSKRELVAMREFTGRASRTQLDRWWDAIQVGMTTTDLPVLRAAGDSVPPPRAWADKNPEADRRLKAARAAVVAKSEELNIPIENLLTPDVLRRLAWMPPEPIELPQIRAALAEMGARAWQVNAVAEPITTAFIASLDPDFLAKSSEAFVDEAQTMESAATDES